MSSPYLCVIAQRISHNLPISHFPTGGITSRARSGPSGSDVCSANDSCPAATDEFNFVDGVRILIDGRSGRFWNNSRLSNMQNDDEKPRVSVTCELIGIERPVLD